MDHADRIPIDLGYEEASAAAAAEQPSDLRMTVREDGTVVIDILADQPCVPSSEGEIVVCAPTVDGAQYLPPPPPPRSTGPMEKLQEALTAEVGPLVITPFGVRLKF